MLKEAAREETVKRADGVGLLHADLRRPAAYARPEDYAPRP